MAVIINLVVGDKVRHPNGRIGVILQFDVTKHYVLVKWNVGKSKTWVPVKKLMLVVGGETVFTGLPESV